MNWSWLSFVVGLLVGWLLEWLIDYIFWRRKHRAQQAELEACRADLQACQADLAEAQASAQQVETRTAAAPVPLDLETQGKDNEVATAEFSAEEAMEAQVAAGEFPLEDQEPPQAAEDDLGPWDEAPEVARMAPAAAVLEQEMAEGAPSAPAAPPAEKQDLTQIEGIGPKISGVLQEAGILNFAMLAEASVDRLREILAAAGSRYRIADPSTWPQQARLAAEEKWDELEALQDRLSGGREVDTEE